MRAAARTSDSSTTRTAAESDRVEYSDSTRIPSLPNVVKTKTFPRVESSSVAEPGSESAMALTAFSPDPLDVDPVMLKMDIDHADCRYLEQALNVVRPLIIFFEIWAEIPPPFDYREGIRET